MDILDILSSKKVLYAEDEPGIRGHITKVLELFFHKVVAVEDGLEATYEMDVNSYDVLIFDICMPHLDGLDALQKIREKDPTIPVIILSAHTEESYLWKAVELKITKYLTKPYDKNTLLNALEIVAKELVNHRLAIELKEGIIYSPINKTIKKADEDIQLSSKESRLLEYLIKRANQTVTFDDIDAYLWDDVAPSRDAIKAIVKALRKKIDASCIRNIYGLGYILEL